MVVLQGSFGFKGFQAQVCAAFLSISAVNNRGRRPGKTFLAGGMVDKAYTIGHTAFAFLSHAFSSSTSALSVLHSLLFQLASQHEDLQDVVCHLTKEQIKSNVTVAVDTLKAVLDCAGHVFLIIDGLDEIDVIERRVLLETLLHLSHECHETRILISSRREEDIIEILNGSSEIIRVDGRNEGSIQAFVDYQLKQIFHSRRFPPQIQDEIKRSLAPLASKAKGRRNAFFRRDLAAHIIT